MTPVKYFLIQLTFCLLSISSIFIFGKGFLLVKIPQKNVATVKPIPELSAKSRVLLLVIDALRYDFVVSNNSGKLYENKIKILLETSKKFPNNTRLYKFLADPPTTTTQRIKAMTTGSLPTFSDAAFNFNSPEISEDNIIDQLVNHNYSIVQIGDDTWTKMYPGRFKRSYPRTSFDVFDLDSVDKAIGHFLEKELNTTDWDLLIAHYLGIDHAGHRYGPDHPEMGRKLGEINMVIKNLIENLDDDLTLIVLSDHGMTKRGVHSGDSDDEISSVLFVYSRTEMLNLIPDLKEVQQIDFVSTIAGLFNIPIPFSNLGSVIFNLLPKERRFNDHKLLMKSNLKQIVDYMIEYDKKIDSFFNKLEDFKLTTNNLMDKIDNSKELLIVCNEFHNFTREILDLFRGKWVQFNYIYLIIGLIYFLLIIITFSVNSEILITSKIIILINIATILLKLYVDSATAIIISILIYLLFFIMKNNRYLTLNDVKYHLIFSIPLISLFTTSYIIEEAQFFLFLLNTSFLIYFFNFLEKVKLNMFVLIILLGSSRFSSVFWQCREEQLNCENVINYDYLSLYHKVSFFTLCVLILLVRFKCLKNNKFTLLCNLITVSCLILIYFYFIFKDQSYSNLIAKTFYAILSLGMILKLCKPFYVSEERAKFASQFCYFYIEIWLYALLLVVLLLGDYFFSVLPMVLVLASLMVLSAVQRVEKSSNFDDLLEVSQPIQILWLLSSSFFFYGTGHQATFSNIPWDAAFVGIDRNFQNLIMPGVLVVTNIFSSTILHVLLLPILMAAPLFFTDTKLTSGTMEVMAKKLHKLNINFLVFQSIRVFVIMLSCIMFRRHVMAFSVFTPKLIYESLSLIVGFFACLLNYSLFVRYFYFVK